MSILATYADYFLPRYHNFPQCRYVSLLLVRQVESEAIFRTEGSGEPLNKEFVHAGMADSVIIPRIVISKRKQTAVERRTGRELLRQFGLLHAQKTGEECALNRNMPCEKCLDCMIYGFAAGGGGAQRSRVITDDAFSLHAAQTITDTKQFNALFDNSTMWDRDRKAARDDDKRSKSLGTDEYVRPEAVFLDIETLRDLTLDEFIYTFGNVLRSQRYGAISSRIGKMRNHVAGLIFSDCEIFSNLELTQAVYDRLRGDAEEPNFPIRATTVIQAVREEAETLCASIPGRIRIVDQDEVSGIVTEVTSIYQNEELLRSVLTRASAMYG